MHNTVNIVTLGCSKNLVDSEVLATHVKKTGINIVFDGNIDSGNIAIINTCGFINDAKEESIETIFDFVQAKTTKKIDKVFVMGCLSERYKDDLIKDIPEIDGIFGVNDLPQIISKLKIDYKKNLLGERIISTPDHYAFLKISEGCNRKCSFCAIPNIRGNHISTPIEELVKQAKYLTENQVKELLLISQDTSFYGKDLYNGFKLRNLLEELLKIDKLKWLRLHYLYPTNNLESIIELMAENQKFCNYIDIPFQHISNNILQSMKRGHDEKRIRNLIEMFRKKVPDIALRTTMIVGYPNETDKDFQKLYDFVEETKFERLGVFSYSEEEGTPAADLEDNVPDKIKTERLEKIMELQTNISFKKNQEKVGKTFRVLVDNEENEFYVGRTEFDSPEVDNEVLIEKTKELKIGEFYNVEINSAEEFDLYGSVSE